VGTFKAKPDFSTRRAGEVAYGKRRFKDLLSGDSRWLIGQDHRQKSRDLGHKGLRLGPIRKRIDKLAHHRPERHSS
jgi:hypothetical protein